ncbi:MAG: hypothetical protein Q8936_12675 [Bacillota bacterium]|nr:hypothetical protein [Bacillota bacterium]
MIKIILVLAALIVVYILYHEIVKKFHFKCPNCGHSFKAKEYQLMFTVHASTKHYIKCPKCKKRAFMEQIRD